jgi:hypothetical protein
MDFTDICGHWYSGSATKTACKKIYSAICKILKHFQFQNEDYSEATCHTEEFSWKIFISSIYEKAIENKTSEGYV